MDQDTRGKLISAHRNEITEHKVYQNILGFLSDPHNRDVIARIAEDELKHHDFFKEKTGVKVNPRRLTVLKYTLISRLLGVTFAIKLMEKGEDKAQSSYSELEPKVSGMEPIITDETKHEDQLIAMLDEERLMYMGSVVLGLNDALVELLGALAGLTLALRNAQLVAATGLITGIAASFSMAASEYLSEKSEEGSKSPGKASLYTGSAYILTVVLLIFPYLALDNVYLSLAWTGVNAVLVILFFTYYISISKDLPFKRRFAEMAGISLGVAILSFFIGLLVRTVLGVEV
jgi:VIT1/CCC1 family predicted Fe2+/Mn2+ transporter